MLKTNSSKALFLTTYFTFICLQIYSAFHHQLFGDEAFYWLESQNLAWSYAELPGWTQWMIALSQWLLPQHEFTIRLPGLLAAWTIPWIGMLINQRITQQPISTPWQTGLLLLALPLLAVAGILAIPDIWLIFFGMWAVFALIQCIQKQRLIWFLFLGLILACGINVHVRFWLITFIAALLFVWQFRQQKILIKRIFVFTIPVMLLGFVPVLLFNMNHDFLLLSFQLDDRHPWRFQTAHFSFFPIQLLVTSPLVFWLCLKTMLHFKSLSTIHKLLTLIAVVHWLMYALIGFYSDNLRFNLHWTVFSYVILLTIAGSLTTHEKLRKWSVYTGIFSTLSVLIALIYALHIAQPISNFNAQLTDTYRGWNELAKKTDLLLQNDDYEMVVTDSFMTLAELEFYLKKAPLITSLSHPSNRKHGREQQLDIMNYLQKNTKQKGLLIVEHNSLKLSQMIPFYTAACDSLNGIQLTDTLDYKHGVKTFYFFETGQGQCHLPPISYIDNTELQLNGWVLLPQHQTVQLSIKQNSAMMPLQTEVTSIGDNPLFSDLHQQDHRLWQFKSTDIKKGHVQLVITYPQLAIYLPRFLLH